MMGKGPWRMILLSAVYRYLLPRIQQVYIAHSMLARNKGCHLFHQADCFAVVVPVHGGSWFAVWTYLRRTANRAVPHQKLPTRRSSTQISNLLDGLLPDFRARRSCLPLLVRSEEHT